ncbi:MAG TPA: hypothetical protein VNL69_04115 [Bacteroidota bacterium]|nr:hypothetical protein [Bacteroidota bacterium]
MSPSPFSSRAVVVSLLLYVLVAVICTGLPLLNYLGYEFSAVIALLGSFISAFLTIGAVQRAATSSLNEGITIRDAALGAFRQSLARNLLLLLVPLVLMFLNAFFVKNCSLLEGFAFFLLIPVVSVVFSSAFGLFCAVHYRRAKTVFTLFVLATFVEVLAVGYFTPAIFSYNFFYGYFPGLSYDEALGVSSSLVLFRVFTLILAAALVWMAVLVLQHVDPNAPVWEKGFMLLGLMVQGRNVLITGAIATLIVLTWWFRGELGFDSSSSFVRRRLGGIYESPHFRIYYSPSALPEDELPWLAAEHEFRLKQIADILHVTVKGKIESYIYPSADVKQRLIGAGTTNIAKPWSGQIHITQQSLDATLKHELVHVLAAPFGLPIIKASLSTGLVEGLAMAIEWDWGNRTLHQYAAAMKKLGVGPDISSIMSFTGFASHSSSVSYVIAGSFCRFLMDTYGARPLMLVYRTGDYEKAFGKPLQNLVDEWKRFLDTIDVTDADRDAVDVLFRRPAIFGKVCARVVASRNARAAAAFARGDYATAADLYKESYDDGRGYEALSGYLSSTLRAGRYASVVVLFDSVAASDTRPRQYLPLLLTAGLAHWGLGQIEAARSSFQRLVASDVNDQLTETAQLCLVALRDSVNRPMLFRYFAATTSDSQRLALLDSMKYDPARHPTPLYLKAKVLLCMKRWQQALDILQHLRMTEPRLEASRLIMMGTAAFRLRRFEDAKLRFWQSLNFAHSEVQRLHINEWLDRCEWAEGFFTSTGR